MIGIKKTIVKASRAGLGFFPIPQQMGGAAGHKDQPWEDPEEKWAILE